MLCSFPKNPLTHLTILVYSFSYSHHNFSQRLSELINLYFRTRNPSFRKVGYSELRLDKMKNPSVLEIFILFILCFIILVIKADFSFDVVGLQLRDIGQIIPSLP